MVYARVSTAKQKKDLETQAETVVSYCNNNGVKVHKAYKDIASGMNFDRKQFKEMLGQVPRLHEKHHILNLQDRFSSISFDMPERKKNQVGQLPKGYTPEYN